MDIAVRTEYSFSYKLHNYIYTNQNVYDNLTINTIIIIIIGKFLRYKIFKDVAFLTFTNKFSRMPYCIGLLFALKNIVGS